MTYKKFCINCMEIKSFVYDNKICHSKCCSCSSRFGIKVTDSLIVLIKDRNELKEKLSKAVVFKEDFTTMLTLRKKELMTKKENKERVKEIKEILKLIDCNLKEKIKGLRR